MFRLILRDFMSKGEILTSESKNLIYIYLESVENFYQSREKVGLQKNNLTPGLITPIKEISKQSVFYASAFAVKRCKKQTLTFF